MMAGDGGLGRKSWCRAKERQNSSSVFRFARTLSVVLAHEDS